MWKILILAAVLAALRILYFFLNHETLFPIGRKTAAIVASAGVFHYTSMEIARQILLQQCMQGHPDRKSTFPWRRSQKIVWLLLHSDRPLQRLCRRIIVKRHCPNRPNGHDRSVRYEAKLLITGIDPSYCRHMYYNLEGGLGCYCQALEGVNIAPAPLDDIDRKLGIASPEVLSEYLSKGDVPL